MDRTNLQQLVPITCQVKFKITYFLIVKLRLIYNKSNEIQYKHNNAIH